MLENTLTANYDGKTVVLINDDARRYNPEEFSFPNLKDIEVNTSDIKEIKKVCSYLLELEEKQNFINGLNDYNFSLNNEIANLRFNQIEEKLMETIKCVKQLILLCGSLSILLMVTILMISIKLF